MLKNDVALLCARLSKEIYEQLDGIVINSIPGGDVTPLKSDVAGTSAAPDDTWAQIKTDTQAAVIYVPTDQSVYIAFRGSEKNLTDWSNNFQFRQQYYPYGDPAETDVRFHLGFMTAYLAVRHQLLEVLTAFPQAPLTFTGHSLGGALATIAALDVQYNLAGKTGQAIELYTYGSPRVGNDALVESFNRRVPNSYRFVYGLDVVTRVPRQWQGYEHVSALQQLGSRWTWRFLSRRVSDHDIDNYIAALEAKV